MNLFWPRTLFLHYAESHYTECHYAERHGTSLGNTGFHKTLFVPSNKKCRQKIFLYVLKLFEKLVLV
jgi:hypothetical protein